MRIAAHYPELKGGHKWRACVLCAPLTKRLELKYDGGTVEPVEDEVLAGAESGATGVVTHVELTSGSWAGGDAAGYIWMSGYTGASVQMQAFEDDEAVTGSGGAALVADGAANEKYWGRLHPDHRLVEEDGKYYCIDHWRAKFMPERLEEAGRDMEPDDGDRDDG